ncbi:hypothetical protein HD806DRAFT_530483 [Xylariaceae sp. AK1471]|nr:hypothetical protein HD806DRAFT_530483 [Xylariaceae sp. AK1471]
MSDRLPWPLAVPCRRPFLDSPDSGKTGLWEYDIRTDPALQGDGWNVFDINSAAKRIILPLQSAIENAIGNLTESPDIQAFTGYTQEEGVTDIKVDVAYTMSKVGITTHADKLAAKLSSGNKRKLSLDIALTGSPPVLLFNESSSAIVAASKRALWKTLEAVAQGRSILITTHLPHAPPLSRKGSSPSEPRRRCARRTVTISMST